MVSLSAPISDLSSRSSPVDRPGTIDLDYGGERSCAAWPTRPRPALPWYSSVHRGAGFASAVTTAAYAEAHDTLVFTRNTTDALNLLAACLPGDTTVISFASEHHANLLPWQRGRHVCLPVPRSVEEALSQVEAALAAVTTAHALVAVTGASNVTGELWPVAELARIAHRHGARIAVDAARSRPTARSISRRSAWTTSRSRGTRSTRPSAAACSSGAPTGSTPRSPGSRAAARCGT